MADVSISQQRREIQRKKRAKLEASLTAEGENIEDIDKTEAEIRLEQINEAFKNDEGPGPDSNPGAGCYFILKMFSILGRWKHASRK